jgi:hypothetical protein
MAKRRKQSRISKAHFPLEGHRGRSLLEKLYAVTDRELYARYSDLDPQRAQNSARAAQTLVRKIRHIVQCTQARRLRKLYSERKSSDGAAIVEGLVTCIQNDLPIPRWCADGFLSAYNTVYSYKAKSWDDVFGRPHPKGVHLGALLKRDQYAPLVRSRIHQIKRLNPDTPIDAALFERIGRELGIGSKTLTEEYYYDMKKRSSRKSLRSKQQ